LQGLEVVHFSFYQSGGNAEGSASFFILVASPISGASAFLLDAFILILRASSGTKFVTVRLIFYRWTPSSTSARAYVIVILTFVDRWQERHQNKPAHGPNCRPT